MTSEKNVDDDEGLKVPPLTVKFSPTPKSQLESYKSLFPGYSCGLVKSEPGGFVTKPYYAENAAKVYGIRPRKDDVWLLTFPKCGTTWTSELLWQVLHNCDFETAAKKPLITRAIFPDMAYLADPNEMENSSRTALLMTPDKIDKLPSPRLIRPHIPLYLLHPGILETSKVVYVARNPKDTIVSFYFHHKLFKGLGYEGTLEEFAEFFMNDEVLYAPYFPHVLDAWQKRHHPNMHFMFYEDMKKDLRGEIEKVVQFLGKSLTEEQLSKLTQHLRIDNFEKNTSVNNESLRNAGMMKDEGKFIRKGKTGDWMNHFSPELNKKIDDWVAKNLAGSDLKFVTQLEQQD